MTLIKKEITSEYREQIKKLIEEKVDTYRSGQVSWKIETIESFSMQPNEKEDFIIIVVHVTSSWISRLAGKIVVSSLSEIPNPCYDLYMITRQIKGEKEDLFTRIFSNEGFYEGVFSTLEKIHKMKGKIIRQLEELSQQKDELDNLHITSQELRKQLSENKNELLLAKQRVSELQSEIDQQNWLNKNSVHNILLIGRTGSGKSTLANVLVNKNGNFEEVFKESGFSVSKTKDIQSEEFETNKIKKYKVVDTIGFSDTKLSKEQVLNEIARAAYSVKDGLSQILFVTNGRFTEEEMLTYQLLETVIFGKDISKYITIVRTNFSDFRKPENCEKDKKMMIDESKGLSDLIHSCNSFIHVNNLSKEDDPNLKTRFASRDILLNHLENSCREMPYRPNNLKDLNEKIGNPMSKMNELQKELSNKRERIEELEVKEEKGELRDNERKEFERYKEITGMTLDFAKEVNKQTLEYIQEKTQGETKGLLRKWVDIIAETGDKIIEFAKIVQCDIM